jgi:hypothetical protein
MKRISTTSSLRSTALALALAGAGALAFGAVASALPPERQAGGISYVTGGVADDAAAAFKQARADYPLAIELVQKSGGKNEYTAGAQVQVTDMAGNVVFGAPAEGPFMLVRIPPGQYRVRGTLNGRSVEAPPVTVGAQGGVQATVVFPPRTD